MCSPQVFVVAPPPAKLCFETLLNIYCQTPSPKPRLSQKMFGQSSVLCCQTSEKRGPSLNSLLETGQNESTPKQNRKDEPLLVLEQNVRGSRCKQCSGLKHLHSLLSALKYSPPSGPGYAHGGPPDSWKVPPSICTAGSQYFNCRKNSVSRLEVGLSKCLAPRTQSWNRLGTGIDSRRLALNLQNAAK